MDNLDLPMIRLLQGVRETDKVVKALQNTDVAVGILAFEGLVRLTAECGSGERWYLNDEVCQPLRDLLKKWRQNAPLKEPYRTKGVPEVLSCVTVFKKMDVPLFTGKHGRKQTIKQYGDEVEDVQIDGATPIFALSTSKQYEYFGKFVDCKRNGTWYSLDHSNVKGIHPEEDSKDRKRKKMTLSDFGMKGLILSQGEIIDDGDEICVLLYAERLKDNEDKCQFKGLKRPTDIIVQKHYPKAKVAVYIMLPSSLSDNCEYEETDFAASNFQSDEHDVANADCGVDNDDDSDDLDFVHALTSRVGYRRFIHNFTEILLLLDVDTADWTVTVLAFEGLLRIWTDAKKLFPEIDSLSNNANEYSGTGYIKSIFEKWRNKSFYGIMYDSNNISCKKVLRSFTMFKTLQVPLFIDDFGSKRKLANYTEENLENISINGSTPIFHVTHRREGESIQVSRQFIPSNNKNSLEGIWFGLRSESSVYGSCSFKTSLSALGIKSLSQGELVFYKRERNVILYADERNNTSFEGLQKPVRLPNTYVQVSIFVPARFLPSPEKFSSCVEGPNKVRHGPFCIKEKRYKDFINFKCDELC